MNKNQELALALVALGTLSAAACRGSIDGGGSSLAGAGGGAASAGSGSGGASGAGGAFEAGIGFDAGTGASSDDAGLTPDSACANLTVTAEHYPVAMYIMLDRSGSMLDGTKWSDATTGITSFVSDPKTAGMKVALQFFELATGQCDGTVYDTPDVPMALLPGNKQAIIDSLAAMTPDGYTPTEGALNGLERFCSAYGKAHPEEKCVGLLVTDGLPHHCNEDPVALASIASDSFNGTPSTPIYAMGMDGADFTFLDQVANAGGTNNSFDVSSGGASKFVDTLHKIAGQALACEFVMPKSDGGIVNPDSVMMTYTPGSSTSSQPLDHVDNQAGCGATGGFYFDDPTSPTKITLCPSTCKAVQTDTTATVQILLDCTKVEKPPA